MTAPSLLQAAELVSKTQTADDASQVLDQVVHLLLADQERTVRDLTDKGVFIERGAFFDPDDPDRKRYPIDKEQFIRLLAYYSASLVAGSMILQRAIDGLKSKPWIVLQGGRDA